LKLEGVRHKDSLQLFILMDTHSTKHTIPYLPDDRILEIFETLRQKVILPSPTEYYILHHRATLSLNP